ncbi:MAG: DegV family protein [Clostridia bacterium]|nr:DegV family protein [Clostridia bacterium]
MGIKIITDSCCDLPQEILKKYNIGVVPLEVRFDDKSFLDGVNLTNKEFYNMMKEHKELPKTASPSPQQFIREFEKTENDILVVTISSGLSSTYNNALIAKEIYKKDNKYKKIHVIDSLSASVGEGLIVLKAAHMALKGMNIDELANQLRKCAKEGQVFFLLDTLENIIKGGRIGKVAGHIAKLLSIKLIMKSDGNGVVALAEKARGSNRAFKRLADIIGENATNFKDKIFAIAHANCYTKALEYKAMIEEKYKFKHIIISTIGPTIGTYSGEGGILVSFI